MCGRYGLVKRGVEIGGSFDVSLDPSWIFPRYNIAPNQDVLAIINDGERRAAMLKWGLIPSGSKDPKGGRRPINARGESVAEKWPFRFALQERRCLIVADGYYEWHKAGKTRTPFRIGLKSWELFAFAGVWETWRSPEGERVRSCCIITTVANELTGPVHDRMPVMLPGDAASIWIDPGTPSADLRELLVPYAASEMEAYEVSSVVNNWRNEDPACIEPVQRMV